MINFGPVPAGSVLPVFFSSYGKTNGESISLSGLAVTDIEIYKGTSMTQRASDAGYTLLDTDGIDIDTITGIHGFSIDTGDNTDASFYAAGSFYNVVVSAVTIDSQTVNFIAATFRIVAGESVAGVPEVDLTHVAGTAVTAAAGIPEVKVASIAANAITATAINADAITDAKVASDVTIASVTGAVGSVTGNVGGNVVGSVASVTAGVTLAASAVQAIWDALTSALTTIGSIGKLLVDNINATISSRLPTSSYTAPLDAAGTRSAVGLASANLDTQLAAIDDAVDTEIATLVTNVGTILAAVDTEVAAIKEKTDLIPPSPAAVGDAMTLSAAYDFAKGTVAMTESYAANGVAPTAIQALYAIHQYLTMFAIVGTSYTVKKLDNATTAYVVTINSATAPTAAARS